MKQTSNNISFTKMHGLGNDFVLLNSIDQSVSVTPLTIKQLGDRHTGIGFDQLLVIETSQQADFFCRIFNADGSEAEQCGNGLRCVARFVHEQGLLRQSSLCIETKAGVYPITIDDYDHIRVAMGVPLIQEKCMELAINHHPNTITLSTIAVGNPHAVMKVDAVAMVDVVQLGMNISTHDYFSAGANVGFMQVINRHHIRLRTFERGAGETLACGSNACAAVVTGIVNGWLENKVIVEFSLGSLSVEWEGSDKPVYMTGPAVKVFQGEVNLKSLDSLTPSPLVGEGRGGG